MVTICGEAEPVRHRAYPLASGALDRHRGPRPSADQAPLVLREQIDDSAHELGLRPVAISSAVRGSDSRPLTLDDPLDHPGRHNVPRDAITLHSEEHSGLVFHQGIDSGEQAGALVERCPTADAEV
ncbi:MAG: hypothetical protein AAF799_21870 [Myxococcota bacterium]